MATFGKKVIQSEIEPYFGGKNFKNIYLNGAKFMTL